MKTVFAGDSITEGTIGDSYLKLVTRQFPGLDMVNLGLNGDTMLGITRRVEKYLLKHRDTDVLFIQAGHNDIIIPSFNEELPGFRAYSMLLERRGSLPSNKPDQFSELYLKRLKVIKEIYRGPIHILTLGCINEDPQSATDMLRREYNTRIRGIARELSLTIIDPGAEFDRILAHGGKDYRTNSVKDVLLDSLISKLPNGTMKISEKRDLELTIDGVHLNTRGAQLYAGLVVQALQIITQQEST